jgi:hypothetical protein
MLAYPREIIDIQFNVHDFSRTNNGFGMIVKMRSIRQSTFYREEQDKQLNSNDLCDMVRVCVARYAK